MTDQYGTIIAPPGYSGPALQAEVREDPIHEVWYFAKNVGPVYIKGIAEGPAPAHPDVNIELVDFATGSAAPDVYIWDALKAQAGTATAVLTFDQWGTLFKNVTNLIPPTTADACTSNANLTSQQYLTLLDTIHTPSCNTVNYTPSNIEAIVSQMTNLALHDASYPSLNWDQWSNYYSLAANVVPAPTPETHCQKSSDNVIPNRWLRMTIRRWLLIFEKYRGCAS